LPRRLGIGLGLGVLLVAAVIGGLSLFRGSSPSANTGPQPDDPARNGGPAEVQPNPVAAAPVSDLAFVPSTALALLSIRVADLWNFPPIQDIWKNLPPEMRAQAERAIQDTGFDMADYERVTVVIDKDQEFWAVLRAAKPLDRARREKLLSWAKPVRWEEHAYQGFTYQLAIAAPGPGAPTEPLATYSASDHVFVFGPQKGLERALDHFKGPKKEGELARVLPLITEGKDHLLVAAEMRDADRAVLAQAQAGLAFRMQGPKEVRSTLLQVRLGAPIELKGTMTFPDEAKADEVRRQMESAQALGRPLIQFGEATGARAPEAELLKLLTGIKVESRGCDVVVQARVDVGKLPAVLSDMVRSRVIIQADTNSGAANLKELALAFEKYHADKGHYPPAAIYKDNVPLYSWRVELLPYLGEQKLYDRFHKGKAWDAPENQDLLKQMPRVLAHPGIPPGEVTDQTCFQLLTGPHAAFHGGRRVKKADIADGTANTLLLVECRGLVPWTAPMDVSVPDDPGQVEKQVLPNLGLLDVPTFPVVLFDGSIHRLPRKMKGADFLHAVNPRDGAGLPPAQ
jgi:hypothetical protein